MAQRANITLSNQSSQMIRFISSTLIDNCTWLHGQDPSNTTRVVNAGASATFHARSSGSGTKEVGDCQGAVNFVCGDQTALKISFDVPWQQSSTGNTFFIEAGSSLEWEIVEKNTGNQATVLVTVRDSIDIRTTFLPSVHGLRYPNRHRVKIPVIKFNIPPFGEVVVSDITDGVCGGMCAVVLDAFYAGKRTPSREAVTIDGVTYGPEDSADPLLQNVIRRLVDSFTLDNLRKFVTYSSEAYPLTNTGVTGWVPEVGQQGLSYKICSQEWPAIKASLCAGRPVVLGLCYERALSPAAAAKAHQVVAWRYQQHGNEVSIGIYDPNCDMQYSHAADAVELRFTLKDPRTVVDVQEIRNGFGKPRKVWAFFDTHYTPVAPMLHFSTLNQPGGALVARRPDQLDAFYFADRVGEIEPITRLPGMSLCSAWANERPEAPFLWSEFMIAPREVAASLDPTPPARGRAFVAHARYDAHIDAFWSGDDGAVQSAWWSARTNSWQHFVLAPPGAAKVNADLASVSRQPEHIDVFWVFPNGQVMSNWFRDQWHESFALSDPDEAVGQGLSVCSGGPDHVCVAWVSQTHGISLREFNGIHGWGQIVRLSSPVSPSLRAGISVRSRLLGHLDLFWIGEDGSVWSCWRGAGASLWSAPFTIAPAGNADVQSALQAHHRMPFHLDVFWFTAAGGIQSAWWSAFVNDAEWNKPFEVPITISADHTGPLGVASRTESCLTVMYQDINGKRRTSNFGSNTDRNDTLWRKG